MPSDLDIFLSLPRRARRKVSRDQARALPIPPLPPRHGEIAERVNAPHRVPVQPSTRSGQQRINAKRTQRAEYWRTVKIRVSVQLEPYFRASLHLLGDGARIQRRTPLIHSFAVDLDVHIPGAPAHAVRAEPVLYSDWNGEYHVPRVDYVVYHDAHGQVIDIETKAEQPVGAAS
jgi:hypothetical protein